MTNDTMTERIIGAAIKVHSALGAGCLESTYHVCLSYQFRADGMQFGHQVRLPITYQDVALDVGYRIDFLVVPHLRQGIRRVVNRYMEGN